MQVYFFSRKFSKWLIKNQYTNPDKLAIAGASNGGLLVGVAAAQRPDLFRVILCDVPLLDMIRYQKFGLANIWAEEYGTSDNPKQFKCIYKYSPYHDLLSTDSFPVILIIGRENDACVDPLHARKMIALLQDKVKGKGPIILLIQKASVHVGAVRLSEQIKPYSDG